jgi:hypothetical protein
MRQSPLPRIILLLVAGSALVLWVTWATRPEAQVHARESQAVGRASSPATDVSTNQSEADSSSPASESETATNAEPMEVVPAGPRAAVRRVPIENVPGPEVGPGLTPVAVLQNMRCAIRDYRARFGGNPFGNNREITAKLNGANPNQVVFLKPEDGMRISERGELIDNWGTPFFFHQISGTEMEIHSAGPDRKMWTSDDLVLQ